MTLSRINESAEVTGGELADYQPQVDAAAAKLEEGSPSGSQEPEKVAEVIFDAATDGTRQLRYISGERAKALLANRYSVEQVLGRDASAIRALNGGLGVSR